MYPLRFLIVVRGIRSSGLKRKKREASHDLQTKEQEFQEAYTNRPKLPSGVMDKALEPARESTQNMSLSKENLGSSLCGKVKGLGTGEQVPSKKLDVFWNSQTTPASSSAVPSSSSPSSSSSASGPPSLFSQIF
ncbi:hypothetical protein BGZ46_008198 [Entomortierella lignicola]|nr:hypothetical protein BGZ46_008198 [Entomortierella lignicola]